MAFTPKNDVIVQPPNNLGSSADTSVGVPNNVNPKADSNITIPKTVTPEANEDVLVPRNLVSEADGSVLSPNNLGPKADSNIGLPSNLASEADQSISVPSNVSPKVDVQVSIPNNKAPAADVAVGAPNSLTFSEKTNLLLYSEEADNVGWIKSKSGVTPNVENSPLGNLTADRLTEDSTNGQHYIEQSVSKVAKELHYTFSVYIAGDIDISDVMLEISDGTNGNRVQEFFDIASGVVIGSPVEQGSFSYISSGIEYARDGWRRYYLTVLSGSELSIRSRLYLTNGTNDTFLGDGVSNVLLWGFQLNQDVVPGYYSKTVAESTSITDVEPPLPLGSSSDASLAVPNTLNPGADQDASAPNTLNPRADNDITVPRNVGPQADVGVQSPRNTSAKANVSVGLPNSLGPQADNSLSLPNTLPAVADVQVSVPNNKSSVADVQVSVPNNKSSVADVQVSVPNNVVAEANNLVVAPRDITTKNIPDPSYSVEPILSLNFESESYSLYSEPQNLLNMMDYSRNSSATYIKRFIDLYGKYDYKVETDHVGLVENLVLYSEQFNHSSWTKTRSTIKHGKEINPLETRRDASLMVNTSTSEPILASSSVTITSGAKITFSIYVKPHTLFDCSILAFDGGANGARVHFNLKAGKVKSSVPFGTGWNGLYGSVEYLSNGWFRISATFSTTGTVAQCRYNFAGVGESSTTVATVGLECFVWGAQMVESTSPLPYVKTLSSKASKTFIATPRIEYDWDTGKSLGFLSEGDGTNLALRSEDFKASPWNVTGAGGGVPSPQVYSNLGISPEKATNADRIEFDCVQDTTDKRAIIRQTVTTSGLTTISCWIRKVGGAADSIFFHVQGGISDLMLISSQWKRYEFQFNFSGSSNFGLELRGGFGAGGTTLEVEVWGFQIESQGFATSYIKTEGSSVSRGKDVLDMRFQGNNKSLYLKGSYLDDASNMPNSRGAMVLDSGSNANRIIIYNNPGRPLGCIGTVDGSTRWAFGGLVGYTAGEPVDIAVTYEVDDVKYYINGELNNSNSSTEVPNTNTLRVGHGASSGSATLWGHVKIVNIYDKVLTSEEVARL